MTDLSENEGMNNLSKEHSCIGIVGLGLIGGSLGLDLQKTGWEIHGLVHKDKTLERAKSRGLANVISKDPKILSDCDLIIIALPLENLLNPSKTLINALPQKAIITDVGSVKSPVIKTWQKLHPLFVASHPMAGTSSAGVEAGQIGLFKNRPWICTPNEKTNQSALEKVKGIAIDLKANWITADAENHDQAVALISHLPVLISAALLKTLEEEKSSEILNLAKSIASSGFEDTSRVGGGNPELGTAMTSNNSKPIIQALKSYILQLENLEKIINDENWLDLKTTLLSCKNIRPEFMNKSN